jgi:hypothetical protein
MYYTFTAGWSMLKCQYVVIIHIVTHMSVCYILLNCNVYADIIFCALNKLRANNLLLLIIYIFLPWRYSHSGPGPPQYQDFAITLRYTTLGRTLLDEWSVWRRDLCVKKHNIHNKRHLCLWLESSPKTQQASGRRPTPYTAQPLGLATL